MIRATYVTALEHCALLLAEAHKEAARLTNRGHDIDDATAIKLGDRVIEFTALADKISVNVFGRTASDLL